VLFRFVNPLTMWLTVATFIGYAVVYTVLLKPATPQKHRDRRRIGRDAAGAGLAAVTNDIAPEALLLFLIIFIWTPPHFWSLALYRRDDYARGEVADAAGHARRRAIRSCKSCCIRSRCLRARSCHT